MDDWALHTVVLHPSKKASFIIQITHVFTSASKVWSGPSRTFPPSLRSLCSSQASRVAMNGPKVEHKTHVFQCLNLFFAPSSSWKSKQHLASKWFPSSREATVSQSFCCSATSCSMITWFDHIYHLPTDITNTALNNRLKAVLLKKEVVPKRLCRAQTKHYFCPRRWSLC